MARKSLPQFFEDIATLLEIKGENPFKVRAYRNAAKVFPGIAGLEKLIESGELKNIRGIGEALARKVEEFQRTGTIEYYGELTRELPESLLELSQVPGLGPKKIKMLFDDLGISTIGELEYACRENRLITLAGFGKATQEKILKGIDFVKKHQGEFLFGDVYSEAERIKERLASVAGRNCVEVCGSVRRRKEIVRDIDFLVASEEPARVTSFFVAMPEVDEVILTGDTKTSCRLKSGLEADLRVVGQEAFPYALMYFTGSKEHNVRLRGIARQKAWKLNEYGLFENKRLIRCATEEDIYRALGLAFIPPEMREDTGEVEAAEAGRLPQLLELSDIQGLFHVHTDMSDGSESLETMVKAAKKIGLRYIGISDHSKTASYAGGLKANDILRQWEMIDRINEGEGDFHVFKGIESDILADGSLDYEEEILAGFDFIIASVHSGFRMKKNEMEARIVRAMENPYTTMLGHPTGRLLLSRDGYDIDMGTLIDEAARTGTIIELNASPYRLDIDWRNLKYAKEKGVMISINPDAHSTGGLAEIFYGVGIARKGWQEAKDVLNTRGVGDIKGIFTRIRNEKKR